MLAHEEMVAAQVKLLEHPACRGVGGMPGIIDAIDEARAGRVAHGSLSLAGDEELAAAVAYERA